MVFFITINNKRGDKRRYIINDETSQKEAEKKALAEYNKYLPSAKGKVVSSIPVSDLFMIPD